MAEQEQISASQLNINRAAARPQAENRGGVGFSGLGNEGQASSNEIFDTVINLVFGMTSQRECNQNLSMNACTNVKELPCFYEFLQTCSHRREEDLVYGLYCLKHTNATNRTYAAIGTQTSVDMQPIFLKTAMCEKNMFLWSFLTNVTYARAKELISFMNISTAESSNLAKFIMTCSEHHARQNSEEYQRMKVYLSQYCQHAIKCLESISDRDKILIPIKMSKSFKEENKNNKLLVDILNRRDISNQVIDTNFTEYYVPLSMLNMLDQINLLSFRMYCGIDRVALAPNVSITCDKIYIGSGLSIRNAISRVDISKLRSHYPNNIYTLIRHIHGDSVHNNYDVLVLFALPNDRNTSISPPIFIAKRIFVDQYFDIEKLDGIAFC